MKNQNPELDDKSKRFCHEYMIDLNGTQAAIRAGFSPKSARTHASILLKRTNIQTYLQELRDEQQRRTQITSDRVLQELAKIGFANFKNYLDDANNIVPFESMDDEITAAVQMVHVERRTIGEQPVDVTKFKLHDKLHALELIGKHLGMFVDRIKNEGDMQITVNRKMIQHAKPKQG